MIYGTYRLMGDPKNLKDNVSNTFILLFRKEYPPPPVFQIILCQMCQMIESLATIVFESACLEGSSCVLMKVLYQHLPEGTEENH
jgi:hypothetical protein